MRDGLINDLEALAQAPGHTGRIIREALTVAREYEDLCRCAKNAINQLHNGMMTFAERDDRDASAGQQEMRDG